MTKTLDDKKLDLERQKERVRLMERLLKQKQRRIEAKLCESTAKIALQAGISSLDPDALLGAFLEIKSKLEDNFQLETWKQSGREFLSQQSKSSGQTLAICFKEAPSEQVKELMRELKFRWNPFRKEFYGNAIKADLELCLKDAVCSIELIQA